MLAEYSPYKESDVSSKLFSVVGRLDIASRPGTRKYAGIERQIVTHPADTVEHEMRRLVPELVYTEPIIVEDSIKHIVPGADRHIAVLKSYHDQEADKFRRIRATLPRGMTTIEFLQRYVGRLHLSSANDVITIMRINGKEIVEHKLDANSTKDDVFTHLRDSVGQARGMDSFISVEWHSSYSLHDASTDTSVVTQNIHELLLYRASDSFLNALVYGLENVTHPVDAQTHKQFMRLFEKGTEYSRPGYPEKPDRHANNWSGWTPQKGMPLENLLRVNSARPGDTLPFVELLVAEVDGLRPTQDGFGVAMSNAIKDVRGKRGELHNLLFHLLEIITKCKTVGELNAFQGDPEFVQLAELLASKQKAGELDSSWAYSGRTTLLREGDHEIDMQALELFATALLGLSETDFIQ